MGAQNETYPLVFVGIDSQRYGKRVWSVMVDLRGAKKIMYTTAIIAIGNVAVLCFFAWLFYRDLE